MSTFVKRHGGAVLVAVEIIALCAVKFAILGATVAYAVSSGRDASAHGSTAEIDLAAEGWSVIGPTVDEDGRVRAMVRDAFGQPLAERAWLERADGSRVAMRTGPGALVSTSDPVAIAEAAGGRVIIEVRDGRSVPIALDEIEVSP